MIIPLQQIQSEFNLQIKGVIHVGAHVGQEYPDYVKAGIKNMLFFEPVRDTFLQLCKNVPETDNVKLYQIALGNKNTIKEMYVEDTNHGQSCSLLEPGTHLTTYPHIKFDKRESVWVKKLDHIKFQRANFNMLNMDVQGYELEVLKGAANNTLHRIDIIYTEINTEDVYKDCAQIWELDTYLQSFGFKRVLTKMACKSWGDALYLKK